MIVFISEILTFSGNPFKAAPLEGSKLPGASPKVEPRSIFSKYLRKAENSGVGDFLEKQGAFGEGKRRGVWGSRMESTLNVL